MDDTRNSFSVVFKGYRDGEDGILMNIIRCAVEGIDNPAVAVCIGLVSRFFGKERMVRKAFFNCIDNNPFGFPIDTRNKIRFFLQADVIFRNMAKVLENYLACVLCGSNGGIEKFASLIDHC